MPRNANRQFLDFEKPIKDLIDEIERLKHTSEQKKIDYSDMINKLQEKIIEKRKEITQKLSPWQKVQLSRHPDRPYTMKYIEKMTTNFVELAYFFCPRRFDSVSCNYIRFLCNKWGIYVKY